MKKNEIKLDDGTVTTVDALAEILQKNEGIDFFLNELYFSCWWSMSNEGWYYIIHKVEDLPKDEHGNYDTEDLDDDKEYDGGLCTGSEIDAIEMMLQLG